MKGSFKVTISPDGKNVKVDVDGVIGTSCKDMSKVFTDLGSKTDTELKNEYFMNVPDAITVNGA
jgi:hypothetical protein